MSTQPTAPANVPPRKRDFEGDIPATTNAKAVKKLRRLYRHLERQTRANNPQCFDANYERIPTARITTTSSSITETNEQIADVIRRCQPGGRYYSEEI